MAYALNGRIDLVEGVCHTPLRDDLVDLVEGVCHTPLRDDLVDLVEGVCHTPLPIGHNVLHCTPLTPGSTIIPMGIMAKRAGIMSCVGCIRAATRFCALGLQPRRI